MGIRDLFPTIVHGNERVHYECRQCGENLHATVQQCPECGGDAVEYELQ